jgi:hypothetical protein
MSTLRYAKEIAPKLCKYLDKIWEDNRTNISVPIDMSYISDNFKDDIFKLIHCYCMEYFQVTQEIENNSKPDGETVH